MQREVEYDEIEISFRETVQPGQGVSTTQSFLLAGRITQIMFHYPPGTAGLVEVRLEKDNKPFYPLRGYLALDSATPVYYVDVSYYSNEPLTLEVLNRDAVNPHTVSCAVVIRFEKPDWW